MAVLPNDVGWLRSTVADNISTKQSFVDFCQKLGFSISFGLKISIIDIINVLNLAMRLWITEVLDGTVLAFLSFECNESRSWSNILFLVLFCKFMNLLVNFWNFLKLSFCYLSTSFLKKP